MAQVARRRTRWGVAAVLCLGVPLGASRAEAEGTKPPTAVLVEGPHADEVAGWLEDRLGVADGEGHDDAVRRALRVSGGLPLRAALSSKARQASLVTRARAAAKAIHVDRLLLVDLHWTPRGTRVHIWMVEPSPSAGIDTELMLGPSPTAAEEARAILGALPSAPLDVPPPDSAPSPAPAVSEPPPAPTVTLASSAGNVDRVADEAAPEGLRSLLTAEASMGVGMRHFSYVDRITPTLRPYDLAAAPMVSAAASVFLFAFSGIPVLRDFGLAGDFARAFALSSRDSAGDTVGTTWQSFDAGVVQRLPLSRALLVSAVVGYGENDFQFDQNVANTTAALPSVAYRFVRAGVDARYAPIATLSAFAGGSYLDILNTGYTAQLFPRETVGGVEGHLGVSYGFMHNWEISLRGEYTRIFYSMNPVPGDTGVAGGALDEQTRVMAGVSLRL